MYNKRQKTYQSSYRKQLIQLAKFYGIIEIKNYFKSAKRLTNAQLELILIKNRIKLPTRKTLSKLGRLIIFKNQYLRQLFYATIVTFIVIGFFGGAPYLIKVGVFRCMFEGLTLGWYLVPLWEFSTYVFSEMVDLYRT